MKELKDMRKILVRAPNWIGDAVMCLPAIACLRKASPEAEITVLLKPKVKEIFLNNPDIDGTMEYQASNEHRGLSGRIRLSGEIKKRGFDAAILFQNAFDAAFLSFISGIPERIGYARDLRTPLLTRAVKLSAEIQRAHQVNYYLNIIKEISPEHTGDIKPCLRVTGEEAGWAEKFLLGLGPAGTSFVGAAPGASYGPAKRWTGFGALLKRLSQEFGLTPIVFGGAEDREICEKVFNDTGDVANKANLCGGISLRQFMAIANELSLFVTNDSGPMHIASALGVPTVAVFGSTEPRLTGPLNALSRVVRRQVPCSPCFKRECVFGHYDCLASITADTVLSASRELLKTIQGTTA